MMLRTILWRTWNVIAYRPTTKVMLRYGTFSWQAKVCGVFEKGAAYALGVIGPLHYWLHRSRTTQGRRGSTVAVTLLITVYSIVWLTVGVILGSHTAQPSNEVLDEITNSLEACIVGHK